MTEEAVPAWDLVRTAHVVGLRFSELFAALNLTPTQYAVLRSLEEGEGLTQAELARQVLVRPQSVGTLVSSLVEQGLVVRDGPGGRGRRVGLALSDAGRVALDRARPLVQAFNRPEAMGMTAAQASMLGEILGHVRTAMEVD